MAAAPNYIPDTPVIGCSIVFFKFSIVRFFNCKPLNIPHKAVIRRD